MEFDDYSPSETFVVLTADQFVGRDDGLLEQQRQGNHVCRRNGTFSLILRKNQGPHFKGDENVSFRISLRWPIYIVNSVDKTKLPCNTPTDAAPQFL